MSQDAMSCLLLGGVFVCYLILPWGVTWDGAIGQCSVSLVVSFAEFVGPVLYSGFKFNMPCVYHMYVDFHWSHDPQWSVIWFRLS